jgi:hypothetical protein
MSRFLLAMALGLASVGGSALAEPPQSAVTGVARFGGWGYFRQYRTRQSAVSDGVNAVRRGFAKGYRVTYEPHRNRAYPWALYLLDAK